MIRLLTALALLVAPLHAATDVWLDVDTAIGQPARDVDDGLALAMALRTPALAIRGVSATFGNASLQTALSTTRDVLDRFGGAALDVHAGARSAADLGTGTAAVSAMAAALVERPLTILALGPLTTVATLLRLHPELHARIQRIVMVAGRRPGQRFAISPAHWHTFPDLNFELDRAAAAEVLGSAVPLALTPWEVASRVWVTPEDLDGLAARGGDAAWLAGQSRLWSGLWRWGLNAPGFNPFDTLAIGYVAHPELFATEPVSLAIDEGRLVATPSASPSRVTWCGRADEAFHALLIRTLSRARAADASPPSRALP